jgi:hypothetical protein
MRGPLGRTGKRDIYRVEMMANFHAEIWLDVSFRRYVLFRRPGGGVTSWCLLDTHLKELGYLRLHLSESLRSLRITDLQ